MAESFAFAIADRVLGKLGPALIQEVGLAWGVKTELEELNDTLSTIRAVLLDAEEKQATSHQLRDWLGKLKDGFYDAEDIVDEFEYEALRQKVVASGSFKTKVCSFFSSPKSLAFNLKMGHRVKKIRGRLDKIAADKSKFNLIEAVANTPVVLSKREMTHSFVRASDVIGRVDDKKNIVGLLMQPSDTENVSVTPIVGIGGLGKTTLAKLVYNDERVVGQFSTKMWVCVSDEFDIEKLIKKILKEIRKGDESYSDSSMEQLQSHLRNALDGEKFLLVLDDVWNTDREKWLKLNKTCSWTVPMEAKFL
ncbi:Disease resistance protein RGA2 [Vitis vinifera]|uniref:Disease resistance protein RGA2 n=1 Tax=Vitis vinifera TaxID=29760 RepID=A0A438K9Y7_VITVI|nr:Disease resistance protein RGA2 [Vitis vinifera]